MKLSIRKLISETDGKASIYIDKFESNTMNTIQTQTLGSTKTIEETNIIRLSAEDQIRFVDLLLNPPTPSPVLLKAFERNRELFGIE